MLFEIIFKTKSQYKMKNFYFFCTSSLLFYLKKVKSSFFLKDVYTLTIGTIISQVILICTIPILSRIFSPNDYGLLTVFNAVLVIVSQVTTLSFAQQIILAKKNFERQQLLLIAILSSVGIGIILLFFLFLISNSYVKLFNIEVLIDWWIPFAFFGGIILSNLVSINLWLNKNSFYKKIAILQITQALILSFLSLVMGFLSIKNSLIFSQFFTFFIMLVIFILFCELKFKKYHFIGLAKTAKKYINAIKFIYPGNILDIFSSQLPFLLITLWFSQEMTGHYRMAYSFLNVPAAFFGSAVAQIFYKRFSQAWPDMIAAKLILKKTWLLLFLVGLPFFLITVLAGEKILPFVLGSSWKVAGNIASTLSILSFLSLLFSTTSTCFLTMRNEYLYSTYNFFVLFNRISSLYIGYLQNDLFFALKMLVVIESITIIIFQYIILKKINKKILIYKKI